MTKIDEHLSIKDAVEAAHNGEDLTVKCAAHDDGSASLHVTPSESGVLLKCFAGCETADVLDAAGLDWGDLFSEDSAVPADRNVGVSGATNVYVYRDKWGQPLYEVVRAIKDSRKSFLQRLPLGPGQTKHTYKLGDTQRVLYRLPQILTSVKTGAHIYLTEGEKDADTLVGLGNAATCNTGGAGKYESYSQVLSGATVTICADADEPGRAHARNVRAMLLDVGCRVEIREAPAPHKDVTELIKAGGQVADMLVTVPFEEDERVKFGIDVLDVIIRRVDEIPFVIPRTLARKERLLLTAGEGTGKSQLLRQMAMQAAAGIHWFSNARIPPQKVLYIDAENEPGQTLENWQKLVELAEYHGEGVERGNLTILEEWDNSDLDLSHGDGTAWLHERIYGYQPDICLLGPLTNVVARDLKDDEPVRRLKRAINSARAICGTAFVMEHHSPHKSPGDKQRSVRPYGSSMFLRWPDYGYGLLPDVDGAEGEFIWERTRWPRVRTRIWPDRLKWGNADAMDWPWMEAEPRS